MESNRDRDNDARFFVPMGEWDLADMQPGPRESGLSGEQLRALTAVADFQVKHNATYMEMRPFSRRALKLSAAMIRRLLDCYEQGKPCEPEDEAAWEAAGVA